MKHSFKCFLAMLSFLLLAACASRQELSPQQAISSIAAPITPAVSPTVATLFQTEIRSSTQEWITALVVQDLSLRLDIPESEVIVVDLITTEWSDAALGCPLPGGNYPPGPVPGLLLHLEASDQPYSYHADLTGRFVLCGPDGLPLLPVFPVTPGEIQDGSPWMPVDPQD